MFASPIDTNDGRKRFLHRNIQKNAKAFAQCKRALMMDVNAFYIETCRKTDARISHLKNSSMHTVEFVLVPVTTSAASALVLGVFVLESGVSVFLARFDGGGFPASCEVLLSTGMSTSPSSRQSTTLKPKQLANN